ncbi:MAG: ATP-dependent zinc metalloprotease FtsH [Pseudomonadota bacterium]|nr:ATP-dependent zinc metalloprotease FtsH [Pseudomonadota bacterium]
MHNGPMNPNPRPDSERPGPPDQDQPPVFNLWHFYWLIPVLLALGYLSMLYQAPTGKAEAIPYSEFKERLKEGEIASVELRGYDIEAVLSQPIHRDDHTIERVSSRVPEFSDPELLSLIESENIELRVVATKEQEQVGDYVLFLIPWVLLILFLFWMSRRISGGMGGGVGGPGDLSRFLDTSRKEAEIPNVRFKDVAGQENTKREVAELVEYLREPEKFERLGAEIPRGVLLMGPPGTGKTLLARALAGEAGVPFYSISASEFIEVFVGVGASRVRRLFETAKAHAPSIIFIDELDSIGRTRGTGLGGGHDEREQTLNQVLAEMDGFSGHEAVIVLAATNRPDVLDSALLRPGRFDRHVVLDLPDVGDRLAILKVHTQKVPLDANVDLEQVAAGTPGMSGADLKNLVNEAAILAAQQDADRVEMEHIDAARDKLLLGTVRTLAIQPEERHRLAVHEAGHTLIAYYLPHADPLYKVTIIPRGRALGGTQQLPQEERHTLPEHYLRDRLAVLLGGRSAEVALLGTVSSGADDDIRQATALARAMVSRWGMSDTIGPVDLRASEEHPFLGREIAQPRHFSEHSAEAVDEAVRHLILEAEQRAQEVIKLHRTDLERLITRLEREETLEKPAIEACLTPPSDTAQNA